jgi:hypothetical protein
MVLEKLPHFLFFHSPWMIPMIQMIQGLIAICNCSKYIHLTSKVLWCYTSKIARKQGMCWKWWINETIAFLKKLTVGSYS